MDRRVTPPKRVTSPTWGPPPPCKQALIFRFVFEFVLHHTIGHLHDGIITQDDVVSQRLKFESAFLSYSWGSKIALFF